MFKRYKMNAKTNVKNTRNDSITETLLKLYERFAPEEVKNSKLETLALGGIIFQTLIMIVLFGGFGYVLLEQLYLSFLHDCTKFFCMFSGAFLGIPFLAFYLAQSIRNPGSRNHKISIRLLQGLGVLWILKAIINTLF
jgi:hypothetical protein